MGIASLSWPVLVVIFVVASAAIWFAGIKLSNTTDILSTRFNLGEALGGAIILAMVTNLPEIAITTSAAVKGNMGLAVGNILGGIAVQTVVLVLLDAFGLGKKGNLTYFAASMPLILEALSVLAILSVVIMGHQLPGSFIFARVTPGGILIAAIWMLSLWLVNKAGKNMPWKAHGQAPDSQSEPAGHAKKKKDEKAKSTSTKKVIVIFSISAIVTLISGVALEASGDALAKHFHIGGVLFGATFLALATSLPEISTGLASVKLGDNKMAMSDIFGGNAFLPVLFLLATLISGESVLPQAQKTDIYLTCLAMLLTIIYIVGMIFRPKKQIMRMGIDSLFVLLVYLLGVAGLFALV